MNEPANFCVRSTLESRFELFYQGGRWSSMAGAKQRFKVATYLTAFLHSLQGYPQRFWRIPSELSRWVRKMSIFCSFECIFAVFLPCGFRSFFRGARNVFGGTCSGSGGFPQHAWRTLAAYLKDTYSEFGGYRSVFRGVYLGVGPLQQSVSGSLRSVFGGLRNVFRWMPVVCFAVICNKFPGRVCRRGIRCQVWLRLVIGLACSRFSSSGRFGSVRRQSPGEDTETFILLNTPGREWDGTCNPHSQVSSGRGRLMYDAEWLDEL